MAYQPITGMERRVVPIRRDPTFAAKDLLARQAIPVPILPSVAIVKIVKTMGRFLARRCGVSQKRDMLVQLVIKNVMTIIHC